MYDDLVRRLRSVCENCKLWDGNKCCLDGRCTSQIRAEAAEGGMKMYEELVANLREQAEWAEANEWETPITLSDDLKAAADAIEKLSALLKGEPDHV